MISGLPNLLTFGRILVLVPIIMLFFSENDVARWWALGFYILACATDFLDGYVARLTRQTTLLGQFLDPVADKMLVATILILLVASDALAGVHVIAGLIILMREILVTGLRAFLADLKLSLPVSRLAKWKTAIQMVALGFLILGEAGPVGLPIQQIGLGLIWLAGLITTITGYDYLRVGLQYIARKS